MLAFLQKKSFWVLLALLGTVLLFHRFTSTPAIDFSTQVKPILNKKCITCHGGVKKEAGFSLLFREEALANTESGRPAILPGSPQKSEMIRRLHLTDPEERMPYKSEPLTEEEIAILTAWIDQGALWGEHWAYVPVKKTGVPHPPSATFGITGEEPTPWGRNEIDAFIREGFPKEGLSPSPEAPKAVLLRRLSLDLTGLPLPDSTARAFLADTRPGAYEALVDQLLTSPHFGERWAAQWLDLARYADTKGYERDDSRSIWRYRDWLIHAFNRDQPYNEFLIEQLAGDLLPDPTGNQLLATAFHRNTMTNDEGGTDNEEFRTAAVMDRVNTTWEALMGTTFACVQCHSHPYDPFRHEDYYKFLAFFNNTRDEDTYAEYPVLRHYEKADSLRALNVTSWLQANGFGEAAKEAGLFLRSWQPAYNSLVTDSFTNSELSDTKWLAMRNRATARLKGVDLTGKNRLILRFIGFLPGGEWSLHLDRKDGPVLKSWPVPATKGWDFAQLELPQTSGVHDLYFSYRNATLSHPDASGIQFDWFYFTKELPGKNLPGYSAMQADFWSLLTKEVPTTPVMMENPSPMFRPTHIFERGNWLVKGAEVTPDVPASLNAFPAGAPRNRLGLALWLTDKKNPLTARTLVNRLWEQLFGTGLVETLEDMGTQGAEPTHRELLDFLAYQFMHEYNWSIKKLLKSIVLSATYRQDSKLTPEALAKDPYNKWYARGPRVRLSAEQVRDQALSVSGLLSRKMYGPGVMPWQPEGIWMSPWNGNTWNKSEGEDQYRRAVYTYWKRTAAYPSMITFDGVGREVCLPRRIRTNTPLQALVTLNDSVYLEAARALAIRLEDGAGGYQNPSALIRNAYQLALYRTITPEKLRALEELYSKALVSFEADPKKARQMTGEQKKKGQPERAAMTVVANALLNLDEFITKN